AVGQAALATVKLTYVGGSDISISGISFAGSSAITLAGQPAFPIVLLSNTSTSFVVQYLPTTPNSVTSQISIAFTEVTLPSVFTFALNGNVPNLGFNFFVLPNGALTSLNPGAQIAFPPTNVGVSATAVVNVVNTGSAPGSVQSVSLSGADYQI